MIPVLNETVLDATVPMIDSIFRVTVDLRFVNSPAISFKFPVLNRETYEYKDTVVSVNLPDTGKYGAWSVPLERGERFITVICVPIGYPPYLSASSKADSVYAWVRQAVLTDIPAQYVSSNHDWRALDSILTMLTPTQAALFERATKKVPADLIDMEAGSIFVSYNSSTQTLTYLRRKQ